MASKARTTGRGAATYRCVECGWQAVKWVGRCGECQAWGTVSETASASAPRTTAASVVRPAPRIAEVDATLAHATPTGVSEFDRVLGGGLVAGSVILLAGEPGIGKSTLLLDVAARAARHGEPVLYLTGEESAAQVRLRAERIEAMAQSLHLAAETDLAVALGQIAAVQPRLVIVDSVQTFASAEVEGQAGGVTQVREVAASLINVAKSSGVCILLVGHVTKDGSIAGPRLLEHLVDVVIAFEGDRHSRLRLIRAVKNRYGPTDEVGCFDLSDAGIVSLSDPSGLFLASSGDDVSGTCVTVTLEGRRPLVCEVQGLVSPAVGNHPRRTTSGLDSSRVAMITAVLEKRGGGGRVGGADCFVATVGGARITEPAADLAIALALASSVLDRPMARSAVAFGEVGLAGEIRPVTGLSRRLSEAARLGYRTAYVPRGTHGAVTIPDGLESIEVGDLRAAIGKALAAPARQATGLAGEATVTDPSPLNRR